MCVVMRAVRTCSTRVFYGCFDEAKGLPRPHLLTRCYLSATGREVHGLPIALHVSEAYAGRLHPFGVECQRFVHTYDVEEIDDTPHLA